MTKDDIKYEDYRLMVFKAAWTFHWKTGFDWEDLCAQANLIYCDALDTWDPNGKAHFKTWLYRRLNQYLLNYVTIPYKREPIINPEVTMPSKEDIESKVDLACRIDKMSDKAQKVIWTIFNTPLDLIEETKIYSNRVVNKQRLISYFRKHHKWSVETCERTFKEISTSLFTEV